MSSSLDGIPDVESPSASNRAKWFGLFFVALGVAMIIVDATIVNVSVPSIIDDLGITSSQAQWVQEAYTLVFAAFLLMFGRLADRWGRLRLFLLGVVIFVLASVLAAVADSGGQLIAARLVQGIGGALMLPTSLSIINAGFRGKDRAIAFAVWGGTIGGTAALGPLLGGWLTTDFSWRWAFGINVPLGLIVFFGALVFVKESKDTSAETGVDVIGALLSVVGIGLIVFGLIEGRNYGWWSTLGEPALGGVTWGWGISPVPVAFAAGLAALAVFALFAALATWPGYTPLYDESAAPAQRITPLYRSLPAAFFLLFTATGWAYGAATGSIRSHRDVVAMMARGLEGMVPYLVLVFFAALFVAMFANSNLGPLLAIHGAATLKDLQAPPALLLPVLTTLSSWLDFLIASGSAKWTAMAPVATPMLMLLGISPEMTTAAYRIGDTVTNLVSPLNPYIVLVLAYGRRWMPELRLGTLLAATLPLALAFYLAGVLLVIAWVALGLPVGPGATVAYHLPGAAP